MVVWPSSVSPQTFSNKILSTYFLGSGASLPSLSLVYPQPRWLLSGPTPLSLSLYTSLRVSQRLGNLSYRKPSHPYRQLYTHNEYHPWKISSICQDLLLKVRNPYVEECQKACHANMLLQILYHRMPYTQQEHVIVTLL